MEKNIFLFVAMIGVALFACDNQNEEESLSFEFYVCGFKILY